MDERRPPKTSALRDFAAATGCVKALIRQRGFVVFNILFYDHGSAIRS
jgi:hypothetical protein